MFSYIVSKRVFKYNDILELFKAIKVNISNGCMSFILIFFWLFIFQCLSLRLWLDERYETVYTRHPGFQKGAKPLLALDNPFPMELPDNLFGEKWAFVQLPLSGLD